MSALSAAPRSSPACRGAGLSLGGLHPPPPGPCPWGCHRLGLPSNPPKLGLWSWEEAELEAPCCCTGFVRFGHPKSRSGGDSASQGSRSAPLTSPPPLPVSPPRCGRMQHQPRGLQIRLHQHARQLPVYLSRRLQAALEQKGLRRYVGAEPAAARDAPAQPWGGVETPRPPPWLSVGGVLGFGASRCRDAPEQDDFVWGSLSVWHGSRWDGMCCPAPSVLIYGFMAIDLWTVLGAGRELVPQQVPLNE